MKLSVIIITKNEENNIVDCIETLEFADEILVVDNNSEDRTVEIAKKYKARVYSQKFNDFSEQRSFGLMQAKGEWVLYVDADERITEQLREQIIKATKQQNSNTTHYSLLRKNFYFGNNEWPYVEKIARLFKKDKLKGWEGIIHESPVVDGKVGELNGYLLHYTHKDLSSMIKKTNDWSEIEAELLYKAGHPKMVWWRFLRIMLTKFLDSFVRQRGWRAGTIGLIESIYQAFSYFIVYAKLWEKQNKVQS